MDACGLSLTWFNPAHYYIDFIAITNSNDDISMYAT